MFKKAYTLFSLVTVLLLTGTFALLFIFSDTDVHRYRALVAAKTQTKELLIKQQTLGSQARDHVQKDLWLSHPPSFAGDAPHSPRSPVPLHAQLFCSHSDVSFSYLSENCIDIVETMKEVTCYLQEDLFYLLPDNTELTLAEYTDSHTEARPMQRIRYFTSEEADYHYSTNTLSAKQIHFTICTVPGHTLDKEAIKNASHNFINGTAHIAQLVLDNNVIDFSAEHVKAHILTEERVL